MTRANDTPPAVLIFRKQILPYSETFIADQGLFLTKFNPYFVGFEHNTSGEFLLREAKTFILEEYAGSLLWSKFKHRMGFAANQVWLQEIQNSNPALIHAHFATDAIDAMTLSDKLGLPLVATIHGYDITKSNVSSGFIKNREKLFHKADKIIAVSEYIQNILIQKGCPSDSIVQHYIGIDVKKFSGKKTESDIPCILFVGRLVEKKGCTYLLSAMTKLKLKFPQLVLNIVGDGPLKKELQKQASENELNVNFLGRQSPHEIKNLMLQSWVFATTSITANNDDAEGLGMVFLEAQALQTPVVSFKSGGVTEAVKDGVTGLLSKEKDIDSLAQNIAFFLENESERKKFGNNGRLRIVEQFNIVEQCKKLEKIYQSVCG